MVKDANEENNKQTTEEVAAIKTSFKERKVKPVIDSAAQTAPQSKENL